MTYDIFEKWKGSVLSVVLKVSEREMIGYISNYSPSDDCIILLPVKQSYRDDPKVIEKFGEHSLIQYPTFIPKSEIKAILLLDENYED